MKKLIFIFLMTFAATSFASTDFGTSIDNSIRTASYTNYLLNSSGPQSMKVYWCHRHCWRGPYGGLHCERRCW